MIRYFIVIWIAVLFLSCQPKQTFIDGTCFTNVSIIDADNGLQDNMTVVVMDGKIVEVVKSSDIQLSDKNIIVDGTGKYIIPGLWDAHVHFAFMEDLAPSMFDLFLAYGITSVRDTGGKIDFVKKWKDKSLETPESAPRVMIAGPLLDGMPNVYDGSTDMRPPLSVGAGSVEEALAIVKQLDEAGVDLIKAYEMLTPEQFRAICKDAAERGLKVTGHVPLSMDVISASNAGMNSMEHLRNIEMSCAADTDQLLQERRALLEAGAEDEGGTLRARIHTAQRTVAIGNQDESRTNDVLDALLKNDTWQIPTLSIMIAISQRQFLKDDWQEGFKYLPKDIEDNWRSGTAGIKELEITQAQVDYEQWAKSMVGKINDKGIKIMAGTDCPIFFLTPGRSLHEELVFLVDAGMTPMEALTAATKRPAEYFNMEDQIGLVKKGMLADLVLLDANPLEDITNTLKINSVIKSGKIYDRTALDNLLSKLENSN